MNERERTRHTRLNALHWDEVFREHAYGPQFPIDEVIAGSSTLSADQAEELGELEGLSGVHLQCGIGLDTLSLARLGAEMTGLDISAEACAIAEGIAREAEVAITFNTADVLDRRQLPDRQFDFVYTSSGVLRWLPSLDAWAANVRALLRTGGWFYLYEIHPLVYRLVARDGERFVLDGNYFDEDPHEKTAVTIHLGSAESLVHRTVVHTNWTTSSVIAALMRAGLRLDDFREHSTCPYSRKGILPELERGVWGVREPPMPLSFSLRASRID